jgi:hypothetical protein
MPSERLEWVDRERDMERVKGSTVSFLILATAVASVGCQASAVKGFEARVEGTDAAVGGTDGGVDAGATIDAGPPCPPRSHRGNAGVCITEVVWSRLAGDPPPRDHHGTLVVSQATGRSLVVFGGIDEVNRAPRNDAWIAPIVDGGALGAWQRGPSPRFWQVGHGAVTDGARIYAVSGRTLSPQNKVANTPRVQSALVGPDGILSAWREETPVPGAGRFHVTATRVGRYLFAIGGRTDMGLTVATVARATIGPDGVLSAWETLPDLPAPRTHHAAVAVGDRLMLLAGFNALDWSSDIANYLDALTAPVAADGTIGPWVSQTLPFGTSTHSADIDDGFVYLVGGFDTQLTVIDSVRRARVDATGQLSGWETLTPLPLARAHVHQSPVNEGVIYSVGGNMGSHAATDAVFMGELR